MLEEHEDGQSKAGYTEAFSIYEHPALPAFKIEFAVRIPRRRVLDAQIRNPMLLSALWTHDGKYVVKIVDAWVRKEVVINVEVEAQNHLNTCSSFRSDRRGS